MKYFIKIPFFYVSNELSSKTHISKKIRLILFFLLILSGFNLNSQAMEVDSFTQRDLYEKTLSDFSVTLNKKINSLLDSAVSDYNKKCKPDLSNKESHRLLALIIFKHIAARYSLDDEPELPEEIEYKWAIARIALSPLEKWIIDTEAFRKKYVQEITNSIYTGLLFGKFSTSHIFRIKDVFIGPDKIDHFFDLGYSYWIISNHGENDRAAVDWGVRTENGWFGTRIDGIFSFADLRANWMGYQFYKGLFSGASPLFSIEENGQVKRNRDFDCSEWIDWYFDEIQNPCVYSKNRIMNTVQHIRDYLKNNIVKYNYRRTYEYVKNKGYFSRPKPQPSDEYLNDQIPTGVENIFNIEDLCK